jgi:hypothetical protein
MMLKNTKDSKANNKTHKDIYSFRSLTNDNHSSEDKLILPITAQTLSINTTTPLSNETLVSIYLLISYSIKILLLTSKIQMLIIQTIYML